MSVCLLKTSNSYCQLFLSLSVSLSFSLTTRQLSDSGVMSYNVCICSVFLRLWLTDVIFAPLEIVFNVFELACAYGFLSRRGAWKLSLVLFCQTIQVFQTALQTSLSFACLFQSQGLSLDCQHSRFSYVCKCFSVSQWHDNSMLYSVHSLKCIVCFQCVTVTW